MALGLSLLVHVPTRPETAIPLPFCAHEQVQDFEANIALAAACRDDADKFCKEKKDGAEVHACLREHSAELQDDCRKEEMRLEAKEAENINLSANLLRACRDERQSFCGSVAPGGARVFRCLAENMGNTDFGNACRDAIGTKLRRRSANWRLDPALRKACRKDVEE